MSAIPPKNISVAPRGANAARCVQFFSLLLFAGFFSGSAWGQATIYTAAKRPLSAAEFEKPSRKLVIGYSRSNEELCVGLLKAKLQDLVELVPYPSRNAAAMDLTLRVSTTDLDAICTPTLQPNTGFAADALANYRMVLVGTLGDTKTTVSQAGQSVEKRQSMSNGHGIAMGASNTPRFMEKLDSKYGVLVVDTERNLEWTKCFVGMVSAGIGQECTGQYEKATWMGARNFAAKLGNGWRLASRSELRIHADQSVSFRTLLRQNIGVYSWAITAESSDPDRSKWVIYSVDGGDRYGGFGIRDESVYVERQLPFMLVRQATK